VFIFVVYPSTTPGSLSGWRAGILVPPYATNCERFSVETPTAVVKPWKIANRGYDFAFKIWNVQIWEGGKTLWKLLGG
jgi:hypothetical protein